MEPRRAEALREVARDVGAVLWPSLGREMCSARNELERLADELRRDPERLLRDESRLALQERMGLRTNRAGWSLGVLAAAHGIDLLHERHEPEGLSWIASDIAEARGLMLVPGGVELPSVQSRVCREWQICLLAAWCVLQVGDGSDGTVRWSASERDGTWNLAFALGASLLAPSCAARLAAFQADWPRLCLSPSELVLAWQ